MERTSLILLLVSTLTGGMLGSLGISSMLRSRRGRAFVTQWKWWGLILYALIVLAVAALIAVWVYRSGILGPTLDGSLGSPWSFLALGVAAGLPFTLFTVIAVRYQDRQLAERVRKRKLKPATRQQRIEFAEKLEAQLREYSAELSKVSVKVQGDRGSVLQVCGQIDRAQAERLVDVLREELRDVNIERVESGDTDKKWWAKV